MGVEKIKANNFSPWLRDNRAEWDTAVHRWLAETGRALGLGQVKSTTMIKERPWSAVHQVVYEQGISYFKACAEGGQHELPLLPFVAWLGFAAAPHVLAAEPKQGWLLLADAGRPLQALIPNDADQIRAFPKLLTQYAELQIASIDTVEQLLAMGLPDRRVERLPALLEGLLADETLAVGRCTQRATWEQAAARLPELVEICAELAGATYAAALDHSDFHRGNVMGAIDDYRLIDWGDACLTHPLSSLLVPLETLLSHVAENERPAWARRLRDAYLAPWEALAPREQLLADFDRALWVGHLVRALNMAHMFTAAPEEMLNQWRPMLFERLALWAEADLATLFASLGKRGA